MNKPTTRPQNTLTKKNALEAVDNLRTIYRHIPRRNIRDCTVEYLRVLNFINQTWQTLKE